MAKVERKVNDSQGLAGVEMVRSRLAVSRERMGSPSRFIEHDVKRAMKGAKAAGFTRVRIHIDPLGNIVIDAGMEPMEDRSRVSALDMKIFGGPRYRPTE